ncbi:ATP-grasp domain-containing protein [Tolypothrix sp. PCC 7910]|uniref:ATP-grasp domain-containing protein n=1 Tax=Tolypothrix sp. PCC 7910 TaxID=2099387 RepID=UPI0014279D22|nr:ATP-grasp domain-containing protein [Tolypothrix sp. PCC 7910]QIR40201.1 ATP-grasp domain-containing protein [Tolypothrix sp. PCC 7910]
MFRVNPDNLDLILLEEAVWVLVGEVNLPSYDFSLSQFFACRRPWNRPEQITAIGRFGAVTNYDELYQQLAADGIFLVHSAEQHLLASELPRWYPLLEGLTPKSFWFSEPPDIAILEQTIGLPLFLKGSRQTSRHKAALSIIRSSEDYYRAIKAYKENPIFHYQDLVCREFVQLRPVPSELTEKIPSSFEFRSFWWRGQCVGAAQYWSTSYDWNQQEQKAALLVASEAALRLNLPFVVIDVAQTITGEWIVIECNDGQESGYAAISPFTLWQNLITKEKELFGNKKLG